MGTVPSGIQWRQKSLTPRGDVIELTASNGTVSLAGAVDEEDEDDDEVAVVATSVAESSAMRAAISQGKSRVRCVSKQSNEGMNDWDEIVYERESSFFRRATVERRSWHCWCLMRRANNYGTRNV